MPHVPPGVEIRELQSPDELDELVSIFDDVWRPDPGRRPVTTDMLRALSHAGNYVAGAFLGDHLAGGSVAFFGTPIGENLHSHMTGVSRRGRGHSVGHALKMHQRAWALRRGLTTITWTFDPLVARNAYFNFAKLGARPRHYYEDFYGDIGDELGGTDDSDRVLVTWALTEHPDELAERLDADGDPTAESLLATGAVLGIDTTDIARPTTDLTPVTHDATVVIPIPRDIETLRRTRPVEASRWRLALRRSLSPLLVDGEAARSVRFLRTGHYVLGPAGSAVPSPSKSPSKSPSGVSTSTTTLGAGRA
ncbi:GNAT family N-acetyltransferase [Gordonia sp. ABSL1-1]|uniref:GNAT family N-acetyltransferase n=1 Tax=Gordonia sp. ABSL1-1 TaxID=3053923 RepID=UPI002573EAFB|nr:GNAT family N-acetyltransferase [Gordonia sp. ABSL1-1]MDL9936003.1 GNAT family N-acetyltransferase [Gordonia sp. ABSL1-1]